MNSPERCSNSLCHRGQKVTRRNQVSRSPILSVNDFASRLGVSKAELRSLTLRIDGRNGSYRALDVLRSPRSDVVRQVRDPSRALKEVQRRINQKILVPLITAEIAHGGIRGRSPQTNARVHLGQRFVVTMDAKKFFPSLRPAKVHGYFRRRLGYGREVAFILTRLLTLEGGVPLGAPTSMSMANLLMQDVDALAATEAAHRGLGTTRFVDDYAFSGNDPGTVINLIAKALSRQGLKMHRQRKARASKLRIMSSGTAQRVTGLNVNHLSGPTVPREARAAIRAAIYEASKLTPGPERDTAVRSLKGRISHVRSLHPGNAQRLSNQLIRLIPGD